MKYQPLTEYIQLFDDYRWRPQGQEMIVYSSEHQRFRIVVETGHPEKYWAAGCWRHEKLQEQGIDVECDDAKEFADNLLNTLFDHLSPYKTQHVIYALQKSIEDWQQARGERSDVSTWCNCSK